MFKNVLNFIIVVAYVIALISGIGSTIHLKAYEVTAFIVILGAIGFPQFLKCVKALREKKEGE